MGNKTRTSDQQVTGNESPEVPQTACLQFGRRHTELAHVDCSLQHGTLSKDMRWSGFKADVPEENTHACTQARTHARTHARMHTHAKDTWAVGAGTSTPGRSPPVLKRVLCHASQLSDSDATSQDTVALAGSHDSTTGGMSSCVS